MGRQPDTLAIDGIVAGVLSLCLLLIMPGLVQAQEKPGQVSPGSVNQWQVEDSKPEIFYLRMGTGPSAGSAFSLGQKMSLALSNPPGAKPCDEGGSCGVDNMVVVAAATDGSVYNIRQLQLGIFDLALALDVHAWQAREGRDNFRAANPDTELRAIARIDAQYFYLLSRRSANIRAAREVAQTTIARGGIGSGMRDMSNLWFQGLGLSLGSMDLRGVDLDRAVDMMANDLLDVMFVMGTPQTPAIREMTGEGIARAHGLTGAETARFAQRLGPMRVVHMPEKLQGNDHGRWWTVATDLVLLARADMSEELAADIAKALWHPRNVDLIKRGNDYDTIEHGGLLNPDFAIDRVSVPVHPGALLFYKAAGMISTTQAQGL